MRVLVLADTHIPARASDLPARVWEAAADADAILHAGDVTDGWVLAALAQFAPTYAVTGNCDDPAGARQPQQRLLEWEGVRIGLVHGHLGRGRTTVERARSHFPDADVIVFGHSHEPLLTRDGRLLLLNPGSPTDRRRAPRASFAWLQLSAGKVEAEHVFL
ncbi:MAG TPA: metallophosphoesterase [Bacillota bacterium]